jgi:hypothetical protein
MNNVPMEESSFRTQSGSAKFRANSGEAHIVDVLFAPTNSSRIGWKYASGTGLGQIEYISGVASFKSVPNISSAMKRYTHDEIDLHRQPSRGYQL